MTVPLVVGNWKMNGSQAQCQKLACEIARDDPKKADPGTGRRGPTFYRS